MVAAKWTRAIASLRLLLRLRASFVIWLLAFIATHSLSGVEEGSFANGELLVKLRRGPTPSSGVSPHTRVGAQVIRAYAHTGWQLVRLPATKSVRQAVAEYQQLDGVLMAEPNYRRKLLTTPNDPTFPLQSNLTRIGAKTAWNTFTGTSNVVVAVIDSGIFYDHEDLRSNLWRNPGEIPGNGIDDDHNGYVDDVYGIDARNHDSDPLDDSGHGTACAGIIGAVGNNGTGIAGINWSVQLMALKYSGPDGFGFDADLVECFEYVIMMKQRGVNIRVTNNSYGGDENGNAIKDAIDTAGQLGILNVFAAGNNGQDNDVARFLPASFASPSIISVAASDGSDGIAGFSNYGRTTVHLAAPGVSVWTTGLGQAAYEIFSGTSAAVPHVAGAAALLAGLAPGLSAAEIKAALIGSADLLPAWTNKVIANGRLNIARAITSLTNTTHPVFVSSVAPAGNRTPLAEPISISFSRPMNQASIESALDILPPTVGSFVWMNGDRKVLFTPTSPLSPATDYTVTISGDAKDADGATLDGNSNQIQQGSPRDNFSWSFRTSPLNDDFASAQLIFGLAGAITNSNRNATKQPGEPNHATNSGGASIWFHWTCPQTGVATFGTTGTSFDTLLAVYQGTNVGLLNLLAQNDDDGANTTSLLRFNARTAEDYFIAVDGKVFPDINRDASPMGLILLSWQLRPSPSLSVRTTRADQIEIAWAATPTNLVLEVTSTLAAPVTWATAPAFPLVIAGENTVAIGVTNLARFFRLREQ